MKRQYIETRFTIGGSPALYRQRVSKSRGYKVHLSDNFVQIHMGKKSLYVQRPTPKRAIWNWV